ncbi:MAG: hypothetical protein HY901_05595 [Deltaproteobacteria bacterium]|nr:hypothetical protein [Deltaproteobacteria bacterium]
MNPLLIVLKVHSVTRYLVLAVAVAALVKLGLGSARRASFAPADRALGSAFVGLLDLQVLLGLVLVVAGAWYPALAGHVVSMLLAVGLAHSMLIINRRRPQPGFALPLVGIGGALLLIAGGLMAIGRGILTAKAL